MYDALTSRYTFACPSLGEGRVALSNFRSIERLEGTAHPVVYHVRFACPCGDEHDGLVRHDELDWAPLGVEAGGFLNLMTSRIEPVASELVELAATRIKAGEWPWTFFCFPEERPRPVFPSFFFALTPGEDSLGLAVRCPACRRLSVNLVSHEHVDLPFHNDREIGVVPHLFLDDAHATLEEFRSELWSASFDARRLTLE
ncbi:MAG TPA: hypothetical protein VGN27_01730 [Gaiellaceae bacterium]|jgi:hypothetical protein|nr:hypothetical protein [Gaiellaceae bacterium]